MKKLIKDSPVPLYYQLYTSLRKDIKDGTLKPGDMLPTEVTLMKMYDVSRATVRHAVMDLVREGLVVRIKSKGTIVNDKNFSLGYQHKIRGFSAMSQSLGVVKLTSQVIEASVIIPPKEIKEQLHLLENERVFYLRRVRSIEDVPCVYVEDWVVYEQCKGIENVDFNKASLFEVVENVFGVSPAKMQRTFECCYANTEEQLTELHLRKKTPLLKCTNIVYDFNEAPIIFSVSIIKGKYTVSE